MNKTIITLVRHGETEWNAAMILQGQKDSPLSPLGIKQVNALTEALKNRKFDRIISSDLQRAVTTAESVNEYHQLELITDSGIRERSFGEMEMMSKERLTEKYPEVMEQFILRNEDFQMPGGESLRQFNKRILEAMNKLIEKYQGEHLLMVAHGGILDCIIRWCFDYPLSARRSFKLMNTAINVFEVENAKWSLIEWGNTRHLKDLQA